MKYLNQKKDSKPILYIVPTPIGNLLDITQRAIKILQTVDLIVAENFLHTKKLLNYLFIKKNISIMNIHNEKNKSEKLIKILKNKCQHIALVCDSGTPLINDPGYNLVSLCFKEKIKVIPLPGPCAAITALSGSGLSTNRFCYEGYLPKSKKKDVINYKL